MSTVQRPTETPSAEVGTLPSTLPVTNEQYADLVDRGHFAGHVGQVELINGRIVCMNPQGPQHADPIDVLGEWSTEQSKRRFRIRIEKPIVLPAAISTLEPDVAWVKRQSYAQRHPGPEDIYLLVEASVSSVAFDIGEKCDVYARAGIPEYWQVNVPRREIRVHRDPGGDAFRTVTTHVATESLSPLCLPSAILPIAMLFEVSDPTS